VTRTHAPRIPEFQTAAVPTRAGPALTGGPSRPDAGPHRRAPAGRGHGGRGGRGQGGDRGTEGEERAEGTQEVEGQSQAVVAGEAANPRGDAR
jgi:hypothetical protein